MEASGWGLLGLLAVMAVVLKWVLGEGEVGLAMRQLGKSKREQLLWEKGEGML